MATGDRISRKHRLKTFSRRKAATALILAVVLAALVIGNIYRAQFAKLLNESLVGGMLRSGYAGDLDSLVIRTGRNYMLNVSAEPAPASDDSAGIGVDRIRQPWPSALPLIFYSRNMQDECDKYGIEYRCVMYGNDDSLVCELRGAKSKKLDVAVIPDKKTKLEKRSLGIILKNIYELDNRDIIRIIDSRIPFGYLATVDVFPAGDIKKRLRSAQVTSIITVEDSQKDLPGKPVRGKKTESEYKKFASGLLDLHPNLAFIDIVRSAKTDNALVAALMNEAGSRDINYIYKNRVPDSIDSIAYAAGLTFISSGRISDYTGKEWREIKDLFTEDLILAEAPEKEIVILDISGLPIGDFLDFMQYMKKLGINILYLNKLSDDPEFTIRDL